MTGEDLRRAAIGAADGARDTAALALALSELVNIAAAALDAAREREVPEGMCVKRCGQCLDGQVVELRYAAQNPNMKWRDQARMNALPPLRVTHTCERCMGLGWRLVAAEAAKEQKS